MTHCAMPAELSNFFTNYTEFAHLGKKIYPSLREYWKSGVPRIGEENYMCQSFHILLIY